MYLIFLSKYETLPNTNKFVLFSTLACLIVGKSGSKGRGEGGLNKMHQVEGVNYQDLLKKKRRLFLVHFLMIIK